MDETTTPPQTCFEGPAMDQAALHGLISRIRDLGLTLISVLGILNALTPETGITLLGIGLFALALVALQGEGGTRQKPCVTR